MPMIRRRLQHWQQESSNMSVGIPALVFSSTMIESDGDSGLCTQSTSDHEDVDRDDDGGETFCRFGRVERHRYLILFVLVTLVKLLLVSSYVSTDFDVHQHWLWITHHLPVRRWYLDTSSQWTLDYPPFFAWFECALSYVLAAICPELVKHYSLPLRSFNAILVHRLSVITCDLMLAWACYLYARWWLSTQVRQPHFVRDQLFSPALALGFLLLWNPALLLLDHIHFQYNGMLTGLLLLAITLIVSDQPLKGAVVFAVLLNFKHLYLYVAPAFFVYLLRVYCLPPQKSRATQLASFARLAFQVGLVFVVSFAPFIGQFTLLVRRLFPFQRGLSHAYWAPNVWAIYNFLDRIACRFSSSTGCSATRTTGGLVQQFDHHVLPSIRPFVCSALTLLSILPILWALWRHPSKQLFVRACILCAYGSFLFGWHVHEKAIVMVLLPITPFAFCSPTLARVFLMIVIPATFAQFPLLHQAAETPTKLLLLTSFSLYALYALKQHFNLSRVLHRIEYAYLFGLVLLQCMHSFGEPLIGLHTRMPFLTLMSTSVYTSLAIIYTWIMFYLDSMSFARC